MPRILYFPLYVLFMLPTYLLPLLGSNSGVVYGFLTAAKIDVADVQVLTALHAGSLFILVVLAAMRDASNKKTGLFAFPLVAGIFDLVPGLSLIPFVPTVLHTFALVLGLFGTPRPTEIIVVPEEQPATPGLEMQKCPYCAEFIKREAIVCRYCRKDLSKLVVDGGSMPLELAHTLAIPTLSDVAPSQSTLSPQAAEEVRILKANKRAYGSLIVALVLAIIGYAAYVQRAQIAIFYANAVSKKVTTDADYDASEKAYNAKDYATALPFLKRAADRGFAPAQYRLGAMYINGRGVAKNSVEGLRLVRLAVAQGLGDAEAALGVLYENGDGGLPTDINEAVRLYRQSAKQGSRLGQLCLGTLYAYGKGVPKDLPEAMNWYRLSADQGHPVAQFNLGIHLEEGDGIAKNEIEAARLYRLSADQGIAPAQYRLGNLYKDGRGVPADIAEAKRWYELAAAQGSENAKETLAKLQTEAAVGQQHSMKGTTWQFTSGSQEGKTVTFGVRAKWGDSDYQVRYELKSPSGETAALLANGGGDAFVEAVFPDDFNLKAEPGIYKWVAKVDNEIVIASQFVYK